MEDDGINHGTSSGYKRCRKRPEKACQKCKDYNNETAAKRMAKARERLKTNPEEFKHGTYYVFKLGCDCPPCKEIGHQKGKDYWANRVVGDIPDEAHGTLRGYNYYKCRCDDCKLVKSFYRVLIQGKKNTRPELVLVAS